VVDCISARRLLLCLFVFFFSFFHEFLHTRPFDQRTCTHLPLLPALIVIDKPRCLPYKTRLSRQQSKHSHKNGFPTVPQRSPGRERGVPADGEASGLHQDLVPRRRRFVNRKQSTAVFLFSSLNYQLILFVVFNI
jgi:hypothetical protein